MEDKAPNVYFNPSEDFKNYTSQAVEYSFNLNGAMTKNLNKGISSIQYNVLNLPQTIEIKSPITEAKNEYLYSALEEKLRVVQKWNRSYQSNPIIGTSVNNSLLTATKTTDYVGNKVYENGALKRILTQNGYIENGRYYFYIKDYLGNNRAVLTDYNTQQLTDFYPFGMAFLRNMDNEIQPYKFGTKEFDSMHGLNQYDFHARQYDPAESRFTTVDPHAENYYSWSPYAYVGNNPINIIDPNGMDWYFFDEDDEGNFYEKREQVGTHRMVLRKNEIYTFHDFNDPEVDAKSIDNGKITRMEVLSDNTVETMMNNSGVKTDEAQSSKWSYTYNNSTGLMDYGHYDILDKNTFYIRDNVAYNVGDIGNYLWGRGMAELGFELGMARMGAHANNAINGDRQTSKKYNFGQDTFGSAGLWDSEGDQRAITNGYSNSPAGKKMLERNRHNNQEAKKRYLETSKTSFSIY